MTVSTIFQGQCSKVELARSSSRHPPSTPARPSSPMQSQTCKPLPYLPLELKREIISHCDAATLAQVCQVSFDFLEHAAPLLYREITFAGPVGLEKFLTLKVSIGIEAS